MIQVTQRVLRFDRFTLDLTRGCARVGDQDIALRPKSFEVLCHLAQNAGRLVLKQELYEAVWPNVTVSDDSIVQCIHELRHKLSDDDHRLIKTVSRRGYLLDAAVSEEATPSQPGEVSAMQREGPRTPPIGALRRARAMLRSHSLSAGLVVAASVLSAGWLAIYLLGWPVMVPSQEHVSGAKSALGMSRPSFKDCTVCPEMVALPAGEFMMGSPKDERGREVTEALPRRVVIKAPIAIGKFEVTVDQFSTFLAETGTAEQKLCRPVIGSNGRSFVSGPPESSFREPGFAVTGAHPAVCISWYEARAYVDWLSRRTGKPYRLPTEAEWEYAARAGTQTMYSFGNDETLLCAYARFADRGSPFPWGDACRSDITTYGPIPVGQLKPNPWGIFDMHGNAWEWVEDCWTPNASDIPADGSAFSAPGTCETRVNRGGGWAISANRQRSATRVRREPAFYENHVGFRVALSLGG
jgi:formylglycine-generating enzyme required for sulfatase activity